jgi:insertion element IS1 protein InsB
VADELIILTDDDFAPEEGQRVWDEPIQRVAGKLREVKRNRQFVEDPQWKPRDKDTLSLVDLLLPEKIPLAGIVRATGVSESWLQDYVNNFYAEVPQTVDVLPKDKGTLKVQMDELWSFVDRKGNKQWIWLALDANTREIIGCHIGVGASLGESPYRSRESAKALWKSIPAAYRQCATVYTDYWEAYETVISAKRHYAVGKESSLSSYIERFNNTLRQRKYRASRCSTFARK